MVRAVRSRRREELNGDILEGHLSSALCHLGNISYRLGRPQPFTTRDPLGADADANATLAAMTEHLRGNMVDVGNTMLQVGRRLTLDVAAERFVGDDEANRHLTRQYRQGYVVPARV
jgi:hypothetical protein